MGLFGVTKKISKLELEKIVLEVKSLDYKQRKLILETFPRGTTSKRLFLRTIYKLYKKALLSRIDLKGLKGAADKYY